MQREIQCQEVVELVTSYLEGALHGAQAAEVEAHLHTCPGCLAYLEQMRTTIAMVGTIGAGDVPDGVVEGLLAAFRAAGGAARSWVGGPLGAEVAADPVVGPW